MFRTLVSGLAVAGLVASPAVAEIPDVAPEVISAVAGGCRPGKAWGFDLGAPYEGGRFLGLKDEFAPFDSMEARSSSRSHRLIGVDITGGHDEGAGTREERNAAAARMVEQLDTEVGRLGRFHDRDWDEDTETIVWTAVSEDGAATTRFEISQLGVGVYVSCQDASMMALAMDEALGRTRVERPSRPDLSMPPRVDPAECGDPARAAVLLEGFEEQGGMGVLESASAAQAYFEHLTQWYGQQMIDAGVWDEDRKSDFALALLEDPALRRGFEQQMTRLTPMMEAVMKYAELRSAGDDPAACRAALTGMDAIRDMSAANEIQWSRATALYRAEARRLGVTLEE